MNKLGTAMGGLLLIGALAAPVAFAHYDTGAAPLAGTVYGNHTPYPDSNRVAGWYYGSTNTYTALNSAFTANPHGGPLAQCALLPDANQSGSNADEVALCQALTGPTNPGFLFAQWSGLGDMEVGGTGDCAAGDPFSNTAVLNEAVVDGTPGYGDGALTGTQTLPDGTFNDGGHGFITHTDHYTCAPVGDGPNASGKGSAGQDWNTRGCNYAPAYGEDLLVGDDLWLATQCNWGIVVSNGAPGLDDIANDFLGQTINCPLGGFPESCANAGEYLLDCLVGGSSVTPTDRCQGTATGVICGNGSVGTTNFGTPGSFAFGPGVAFPAAGPDSNGVNCDAQATASVFPFTAVVATQGSDGLPSGTQYVATATVGWVG